MNTFDFGILHFLNGFAHHSWAVDAFISQVEESNLLKGGVGLALVWWVWFESDRVQNEKREFVVFGLIASCVALLFGRGLALFIPFRERPFQSPAYHFQLPYTVTGSVHSWNSCPSDHAILFFCLATSLWFVSRRVGAIAICHAIFIICLPRVYVGYHYPTDLLAGAVIGIAFAGLGNIEALRKSVVSPALWWLDKHAASFYAFAFAATFEVAELFDSLLTLQKLLRRMIGLLPHG